jgi:chloramphenicol 3-O-phosphotransferase
MGGSSKSNGAAAAASSAVPASSTCSGRINAELGPGEGQAFRLYSNGTNVVAAPATAFRLASVLRHAGHCRSCRSGVRAVSATYRRRITRRPDGGTGWPDLWRRDGHLSVETDERAKMA